MKSVRPVISPLIFLHIPKTGGTSFVPIITRHFPRASVLQLNGTLASCAEQLTRFSEEKRAAIQCIYGHVPFGLHNCLPHLAAYITLLRSPVDRVASAYYYSLRRPEWGFHELIVKRRLSLHDFVVSEAAAALHNGQTRMLSGSDQAVGAIALDRAKTNLRHFTFVGLTERFDESVLLCRKLLGLGSVLYQMKNVNCHRVPLEEIPSRTRALIEKRNSLDLELYDVAAREFDRLIAGCPGLRTELARFRRWNACYSFAGSVFSLPLSVFRDMKTAIRRTRVRNQALMEGGGQDG